MRISPASVLLIFVMAWLLTCGLSFSQSSNPYTTYTVPAVSTYNTYPASPFSYYFLGPEQDKSPLIVAAEDLANSKKSLPTSEKALSVELDRTERVIDDIVSGLSATSYTPLKKKSSDAFDKLDQIAESIGKLDCATGSVTGPVNEYNRRASVVQDIINQLTSSGVLSMNDIDIRTISLGYNTRDNAEYCNQTKSLLTSRLNFDRIAMRNDIDRKIDEAEKYFEKMNTKFNQLLPLLREHRGKIEEALNNAGVSSARENITDRLPYILAIIGVACLGSFFGLKVFSPELQIEWVISGQVIQFMTVMILLSVILALGLANILKENTLGTLLGGIAGYVLAQGVGRQAARDATRIHKTPWPEPPPPPPPPPPVSLPPAPPASLTPPPPAAAATPPA